MINAQYVREALTYDPATGKFHWRQDRPANHFKTLQAERAWKTRYGGKIAGTKIKNKNGKVYRYVAMEGRVILAHRIAFLYVTGRWPVMLDHINGDGTDNRWRNLREVSGCSENNKNQRRRTDNTSGQTGVIFYKRTQQWRARITVDGKHKSLGYFDEYDDAVMARLKAEREHNYHNNHGEDRKL